MDRVTLALLVAMLGTAPSGVALAAGGGGSAGGSGAQNTPSSGRPPGEPGPPGSPNNPHPAKLKPATPEEATAIRKLKDAHD